MPEKNDTWTWKEGYVLALAPAVGLFCVNRYEAGRFAYLGIPTELIDLPVSRLIAGGTAIVVFGAILFACLRSARTLFLAESGWKRFMGSFVLFFMLVALPILMVSTTLNPVAWGLMLTTSLALATADTPKKEPDAVGDEPTEQAKDTSSLAGFAFMSLLLTALIYGFGFFAERTSIERMCLPDRPNAFVAGFYGDRAIVKHIEPKTGRVLPEVQLLEMGGALALSSCKLSVRGMPSFLDKAYSEKRATSAR